MDNGGIDSNSSVSGAGRNTTGGGGQMSACHAYVRCHGVEQLVKDAVVALCTAKPDDPVDFLCEYFDQKRRERRQASDSSADSLTSQQNGAANSDDEDEAADVPPPHHQRRARRQGVSGEAMGSFSSPNATIDDIPRPVFPKDESTRRALEVAMASNLLFAHLDPDERQAIFDAMQRVECTTGDVIIQQGDSDGDRFYVIEDGRVDVLVNGQRVSQLGIGGTFGELALIYGTPRAATCIAAEATTRLWALDRISYRRILMQSTIRKRRLYNDFLSRVRLLADLDQWERANVADALESCSFAKGQVIVEQGSPGDEFFMIIEGHAEVRQRVCEGDAEEVVGCLGPSDYFGEIALLLDRPRAATVIARTPLRCVKLDRARFERVLGPVREILRRDLQNYNSFVKLIT